MILFTISYAQLWLFFVLELKKKYSLENHKNKKSSNFKAFIWPFLDDFN